MFKCRNGPSPSERCSCSHLRLRKCSNPTSRLTRGCAPSTPTSGTGLRTRAALSEHEITTEVERYIAWPGQALAYKLGELQIRRHRRDAEAKLGTKFDQRYFHDAILALGSVPLPVLEQRMTQFIADGGGNPLVAPRP